MRNSLSQGINCCLGRGVCLNWINRIRLTYRACAQRVFVSLLLLGMCTVSFYMIDTNLEGHVNKLYANRTMNEMFGVRTDNVSYVQCLDIQATRADIDVLKTYVEQQESLSQDIFQSSILMI